METYLPVLAFAAFATGLVAAVRRTAKLRRHVRQSLQETGFFELQQPDPQLQSRIETLARISGRSIIRLTHPYRFSGSRYEILLFNPLGGKNSPRTFAVRSSRLTMPRFALYPKVPLQGAVGAWLNKLGASVMKGSLTTVPPTASPQFDSRYFLFASDLTTVQRFFSHDLARALADNPTAFSVQADGDIFLFASMPDYQLGKVRRVPSFDTELLRETLRACDELYRLLESQCERTHRVPV